MSRYYYWNKLCDIIFIEGEKPVNNKEEIGSGVILFGSAVWR